MKIDTRKKHVVSYEKMSEEVSALFAEKYPKGFNDYLPELVKYPKPDGTSFYAVTLETPTDIYLVKINVKTDDLDDLEKWLEGEEDAENAQVSGTPAENGEGSTLPDDNISQYGGDDDSNDGDA